MRNYERMKLSFLRSDENVTAAMDGRNLNRPKASCVPLEIHGQ